MSFIFLKFEEIHERFNIKVIFKYMDFISILIGKLFICYVLNIEKY